MMSEEEGWITHGLEAVEHVLEHGILWKQFREAIQIMQLISHEHPLQHFQELSSNHETTLELLMDLQFKADLSVPRYSGVPPLRAKRTLNIFV